MIHIYRVKEQSEVENILEEYKTFLLENIKDLTANLEVLRQFPNEISGIGKRYGHKVILSDTYNIDSFIPFDLQRDKVLTIDFVGYFEYAGSLVPIYRRDQLIIGIKKENFETNKFEIIPATNQSWQEQLHLLSPEYQKFESEIADWLTKELDRISKLTLL